MSHHFHQYVHWLPSKARLHLSHYFLASDVKNDPLIYVATILVPFSNSVCLPENLNSHLYLSRSETLDIVLFIFLQF